MKGSKGKSTIGSLLVFLMLAYGGFALFKYVYNNFEKKSIKKEIVDYLGSARGGGMTEADAEQHLRTILDSHRVTVLQEPAVEVDRERGKLRFILTYAITVNYVLFKKTETVEIDDETDNYGI